MRLLIMKDNASNTDQIHGVLAHVGHVQVMMCLLSCAEELFKSTAFGMLMLSFYRKISFYFHSLTMIIILNFLQQDWPGLGVNCQREIMLLFSVSFVLTFLLARLVYFL